VGPQFRASNSIGVGFASFQVQRADVAELAQRVLALGRSGLKLQAGAPVIELMLAARA
jgi:hypothetical protein